MEVAQMQGALCVPLEVAPYDMPLDIYEDDLRYKEIGSALPQDIRRSACRVASVQIHYGCMDIHHVIEVHGKLVPHLDRLCRIGNSSHGKRLRLYKRMASHWQPQIYRSPEHFEAVAEAQGFADRPKDCWHLIRISRHGSIEVRAFGNTQEVDRIMVWVRYVRDVVSS